MKNILFGHISKSNQNLAFAIAKATATRNATETNIRSYIKIISNQKSKDALNRMRIKRTEKKREKSKKEYYKINVVKRVYLCCVSVYTVQYNSLIVRYPDIFYLVISLN